jgi:outer membrane protein OmpA-like peptidoglycan-associated protein
MRHIAIIAFVVGLSPLAVQAQRMGNDPIAFVPRATAAVGYTFLNSNAPPGVDRGFTANGGFASVSFEPEYWFAVAAEVNGTHANHIGPSGQDLTLLTYTAGPRMTARQARTSEFGQVMFGAAHGSDSYFPNGNTFSTKATSLAITAGGGLDIELTHRFAWRAAEVQYLHTSLPNGVNGSQNQLLVQTGLVVKFGGHYASPRTPSPEHKKISMNCSASFKTVQPGESVEITAKTHQPDGEAVTFTWTSDAGLLEGSSNSVSIDTSKLTPGHYRVTGHATLVSDIAIFSTCEVPFRVVEAPKPTVVIAPAPQPAHDADSEFHANVRDVLFDYDKWNLRPDAEPALADAVSYLKAHPQLRVLVGGYSDERGSTGYNISLGLKRANRVRDALTQAGIAGDRIEVISYGKGAQVCTATDEACYQRNRRAAFLIQP